MSRQRVAIVGVGSVGGVFASELLLAGRHDVVLCARRPFDELIVESSEFPATHSVRPVLDPDEIETPADWVIVATKSQQLPGAQRWIDRLCGPDTTLVVVQNGIEQADRGQAIAPQSAVIGAVTYCGAEAVAPGHISHQMAARLLVPADSAGRGLALQSLFEGTRATIDVTEHWEREAWSKLVMNVMMNGPCAITVQPGSVLSTPLLRAFLAELVNEVIAVAAADGVDLGASAAEQADGVIAMVSDGRPSMLQDREAGNPMEHDAIYGAVLRVADRVGVEAPRVQALHALLDAIDASQN